MRNLNLRYAVCNWCAQMIKIKRTPLNPYIMNLGYKKFKEVYHGKCFHEYGLREGWF